MCLNRVASQIIGTLVSNPNARRIGGRVARGAAQLAVQAIKSRRARRRAAGKKVVFPYIESNIAAVRNRRARQPLAVAKQMTAASTPTLRVVRTEYSMAVKDSSLYHDDFIFAAAGDEMYFPALAAHASEYQFYSFQGLTVKYNAIQPATEAGQVAIGVVPTWDALTKITCWDDLLALAQTRVTNAWQDMSYAVPPALMNTQVKEFRMITPSSAIDYTDPLQAQGFIIFAVRGSPATATKQIGTMTCSYDCRLSKPQLDPISSPTNIWIGAPSALTSHLGNDHFATIVQGGTDTQPVLLVTTAYRYRLLVLAHATTAGNIATMPNVTAFANCTATRLAASGASADTAMVAGVIVPDGSGDAQFTITFPTSTLAWSAFRVLVRGVGRGTFWEDL